MSSLLGAAVMMPAALVVSGCGSSGSASRTGTVITQVVQAPRAPAAADPAAPAPAATPPADTAPVPTDPAQTAPDTQPQRNATPSPAAPDGSATAYAAQAQAVCDDVNGQLSRLGAVGEAEGFAAAAEKSVEITTAGAARLRAIAVPEAVAGDYGRFVAQLEEQVAALKEIQTAFLARDDAAVRAASQKSQRANAQERALARRLGLDACAADSTRAGETN